MSAGLDYDKLENVKNRPDGGKIARCPACAEKGHDTKGEHLFLGTDGRFGCCAYPGDREHRRRVFALAGLRGHHGIQVIPVKTSGATPLQRDIMSQLQHLCKTAIVLEAREEREEPADGRETAKNATQNGPNDISRTLRTPPDHSNWSEKHNLVHTEYCSHTLMEYEEGVRAVRAQPLDVIFAPTLTTAREDLDGICETLRSAGQPVALDIETYGQSKSDALNPFKGEIRLLSLAIPGQEPWLIDLKAIGYDLGPLKPVLEGLEVIGHNLKFDLLWLRLKCALRPQRVFCTWTASKLLTNGSDQRNDLGECLRRYLQIDLPKDQAKSAWGAAALTSEQIAYAANDVLHLHALKEHLQKALEENGLTQIARTEMDLIPVVAGMEAHGIHVDREKLQSIYEKACAEASRRQAEIQSQAGDPDFNPNSPDQVLAKLREQGVELPGTGKDILAACNHPLATQILQFRDAKKSAEQAKTFLEAAGADNRIHARFNPLGTDTGRFSSSDPNMQNVARGELRSCFTAAPGHTLVIADHSQIELRVGAVVAQELKMLRAYQENADLHRQTAALVLGKPLDQVTKEDRQLAKAVNFGLLYGQSAKGLVGYAKASYGIELTIEKATRIRALFFQAYPNIARWHQRSWHKAENRVGEVRTVTGRRRLLPTEPSLKWQRFTGTVNTPVQGGSADGLKHAMLDLAKRLPEGAHLVSTVHDELIVETPLELAERVKEIVRDSMVSAMARLFPQVPIEVEVKLATDWGQK